jgi:hypothetical protein
MSTSTAQHVQQTLARIQTAQTSERFFAPTLQEVEIWFRHVIVPQRTAPAGFNTRRIHAGPRALFLGNKPYANGLCGDAAAFVEREFHGTFLKTTSTGEVLRRILWRASGWNHIANVLVPSRVMGLLRYEAFWKFNVALYEQGQLPYSSASDWTVLDLYYKQIYTVDSWWRARGTPLAGQIEIGKEHEVGEGFPPVLEANGAPAIPPRWYHKVMPGDWLSKLAITYYNDVLKWPIIHDANRAKIGSDPNKIRPNQILAIPDLASLTDDQIADAQKRAKEWKPAP